MVKVANTLRSDCFKSQVVTRQWQDYSLDKWGWNKTLGDGVVL